MTAPFRFTAFRGRLSASATGVELSLLQLRFIAIDAAPWNSTGVTGDVRWLPAPKANRISTCTHLHNRARFAAGRLLAAQQRGQTNDLRSTCTFALSSSTTLNADVFYRQTGDVNA